MIAVSLPVCRRCGKRKAPTGRSVPMEMSGALCHDGCCGYRDDPMPDCRWPGEETCGPGCTRGEQASEREG